MKQRDYLEWGEVEFLVDRLIEDKQFLIGLFVLIGCTTGMKANDILALHWKDVLADVVFFREKSTGRYYYANLKDETKSNIEKIIKDWVCLHWRLIVLFQGRNAYIPYNESMYS